MNRVNEQPGVDAARGICWHFKRHRPGTTALAVPLSRSPSRAGSGSATLEGGLTLEGNI